MGLKSWKILNLNKDNATMIANEYDLPPFLSALLDIKGITDYKNIEHFLFDDFSSLSDLNFIDIKKATTRIKKAIDNFEKICVYGDYDADGVTATALLYLYLKNSGANVIYYIPDRHKEGYGLNNNAIDYLKFQDTKLIVTVDNGVTAVNEIDYANSLNIDVVITDHHKVPEKLPNAIAIVDPHRIDCNSIFKDFAGVGIALKLIIALNDDKEDISVLLNKYIDFVLIGTIGDIVPIKDQNRLLVKLGLEHILHTENIGLIALLNQLGMYNKSVTSTNIAFTIVPRINAAGRLSSTEKVVKLLTTQNEDEALNVAKELEDENLKRKEIENKILLEAELILKNHPELLLEKVIIVDGDNWHPGVIGIVAARLLEKYSKPFIVITKMNGIARGSARSVEGFSIYDAINFCSGYLIKFGGHKMAAGFDINEKDIDKLKKDIITFTSRTDVPFAKLDLACKLNPLVLSIDLVNQMKELEPFGKDNEEPVFGLFNMRLIDISAVGKGKHLKLKFEKNDTTIAAMKFFTTLDEFFYKVGDEIDLAVTLNKSIFNGIESLSVFIEDMKFSKMDNDDLLEQKRFYEYIKSEKKVSENLLSNICPNRENFSVVYRYLKKLSPIETNIYNLYFRMQNESISFSKFLIVIDIMAELRLISININADVYKIEIKEIDGKIDLNSSVLLKRLRKE